MFGVNVILCLIPAIGCTSINFKVCGTPDPYIRMDNVDVTPFPLKFPGNINFASKFEVLKDIPSDDAKLSVSIDKLTPKRMHIPCVNGFGSCQLNYCEEYGKNFLITGFGYGKCPLNAGKYSVHQDNFSMPNFGPIFNKVMEGDFEGNLTLYSGNTNKVYSCHEFKFTVVLNN